jgi:stringent starvation protein B
MNTENPIANMTDQRPHLITMFYSWFAENNLMTYLVVDASMITGASALPKINQDGHIILNISMGACPDFQINNRVVTLSLRFNGVESKLAFDIEACRAIYTPSSGVGAPLYNAEEILSIHNKTSDANSLGDGAGTTSTSPKGRPKLTLVH